MDSNANLLMQQQVMHYGTHPMARGQPGGGRPSPLGGGGGGYREPQQQQRGPKQSSSSGVIFHPALFGPTVGGPRQHHPRQVPNLRPRQPAPHQEALMFGSGIALQQPGGGRGPGGGGGGGGVPPSSQPSHDAFLEEQVEILHEKMEGLEGELRYAWRALDVLSQEYVKMWQRLEKMEGLLSEQQTVITQLIDLYSVESSDTAPENGKSGGDSPSTPPNDGILVSLRHQAVPDENFYKALNAVHGDANTDMRLGDDQSHDDEDDDDEDEDSAAKIIFAPGQSPRMKGKGGTFSNAFDATPKRRTSKQRRRGSHDSDDAKSIASTVSTVRSEGVGEFPLPCDLSPAGYENMTPPSKPPSPPKKTSGSESKKKKKKSNVGESKIIDEVAPQIGPLQLISGRYSFSLMDANGDGPMLFGGMESQQKTKMSSSSSMAAAAADQVQGGENSLRSQQVANGKPLFPSLQTAMVTPKESTDGQKDKERRKAKKEEKKEKKKKEKEREREVIYASTAASVKKETPKVKVKGLNCVIGFLGKKYWSKVLFIGIGLK